MRGKGYGILWLFISILGALFFISLGWLYIIAKIIPKVVNDTEQSQTLRVCKLLLCGIGCLVSFVAMFYVGSYIIK